MKAVPNLTRLRNIIALVIAILLAWEFVPRLANIPPYLLPTLSAVYGVFQAKLVLLLASMMPTLYEILVGFACAIVVGVTFGVAIGQFRVVYETVYPILIVINSVPKVALAPLIIIWVGFGMTSIVTIVVMIAFFPIMINTISGINNVPADLIELIRTITPSKSREFLRVRIPFAIPYILAGMRTSITLAAVGAIIAEFIVGQSGLGFLILSAQQNLDVPLMFACLTLLVVISLSLFGVLILIEKFLMPWKKDVQML